MTGTMPQSVARQIVRNAVIGMPNEACGFVLTDWRIHRVPNLSPRPHNSFKFGDEVTLEWLLQKRDEIIGLYHTHPSGRGMPSPEDKSLMLMYPNFRHWIGTVSNVYEWRITDDGARSVRRDGSTGIEGMAYPLLEPPEAVRRTG